MRRHFTSHLLAAWVALSLPAAAAPVFPSKSFPPHHDLHTVSFELVWGLVLVQATLNDEPGTFILDTGSPMMILDEAAAGSAGVQANTLQGGLSGNWKHCDLSWAGVHKYNLSALATDISHLEQIVGRPLRGLIGYDFFDRFDLMLDFAKKQVTLVPPDFVFQEAGWTLKAKLPFTLEGHLPVVEAKIGEATFHFGLDTGAGANLCDARRRQEISPELLAPVRSAEVFGLGGSQHSQAADVLETTIGGVNFWSMRFIFTDISSLENLRQNGVDGLLGFPFFDGGRFSISYRERVISIWQ